jgi:hypothetical protein
MTVDGRLKLKDNLIIAATALNIVLAGGTILGGMNWVTKVNTNMETLTVAVAELKQKVVGHDDELKKIDRRHVAEDALCKDATKVIGVR